MKSASAPTTPRAYNSALRKAMAHQTREQILAAVAKGLQEHALDDLSYETVARLAGVAERTVYRHFPTREQLLEAFREWLYTRIGVQDFPQDEQSLIAAVPRIFSLLDRHEKLVRAYLASELGQEIRRPIDTHRQADFARCLSAATEGLPPDEARNAVAIVQTLVSAPAWQVLRDRVGLSGKQAGAAVSWAIEALLRDLRTRKNHSGKRKEARHGSSR